jgi:hypothetical protein
MSGHNYIEKQLVTSIPLAFPNFGIWIAMYIERSITLFKGLQGLSNEI